MVLVKHVPLNGTHLPPFGAVGLELDSSTQPVIAGPRTSGAVYESVSEPIMMHMTPSSVWKIHSAHRRPRMPYFLAMASEVMPPSERAKMLTRPKMLAIMPERSCDVPKYS